MNKKLRLRPGKEESLGRFHPWVFSGAVHRADGNPAEGELVDVLSAGGEFLGRGHYQTGSITVRILTFDDEPVDRAWWMKRLSAAWAVRRALGLTDRADTDCYRLVHGEGDGLPGLVIDIYGPVAVTQCHSAGMYLARREIAEALASVSEGRINMVYDKSSQSLPFNAAAGAADGYTYGSADSTCGIAYENGHRFAVDWGKGQKTGLFLDQRDSRALVAEYAAGRRVLNTFCYTGGFSVYALSAGAAEVCSVDSSAAAVEMARRNMQLNFGASAPHTALTADATEYIKNIPDGRYDLIILDPPAFAKHRRAAANALQAYRRLNAKAFSHIASGGLLFTFSCSQAISPEMFRNTVFTSAALAGRQVRILHRLSQPADHPVNIYHPEGEYLKGLVLYVE